MTSTADWLYTALSVQDGEASESDWKATIRLLGEVGWIPAICRDSTGPLVIVQDLAYMLAFPANEPIRLGMHPLLYGHQLGEEAREVPTLIGRHPTPAVSALLAMAAALNRLGLLMVLDRWSGHPGPSCQADLKNEAGHSVGSITLVARQALLIRGPTDLQTAAVRAVSESPTTPYPDRWQVLWPYLTLYAPSHEPHEPDVAERVDDAVLGMSQELGIMAKEAG